MYSSINSAFASHLDQLINKHSTKIEAWCFGHSHQTMQKRVEGVLCVSNPLGYPKEVTGFSEQYIIL